MVKCKQCGSEKVILVSYTRPDRFAGISLKEAEEKTVICKCLACNSVFDD